MLMDNGQFGALGPYAAKLVEEERRPDAEDVIPHHQLEVAKVVLETRHSEGVLDLEVARRLHSAD